MTKEAYFEMCEAIGSDPIESEVPLEYSDLPNEVQYALSIYGKLKDDWDSMNGVYLGKQFAGILDLFEIFEVPKAQQKDLFNMIDKIDRCRVKIIADSRPKPASK